MVISLDILNGVPVYEFILISIMFSFSIFASGNMKCVPEKTISFLTFGELILLSYWNSESY